MSLIGAIYFVHVLEILRFVDLGVCFVSGILTILHFVSDGVAQKLLFIIWVCSSIALIFIPTHAILVSAYILPIIREQKIDIATTPLLSPQLRTELRAWVEQADERK